MPPDEPIEDGDEDIPTADAETVNAADPESIKAATRRSRRAKDQASEFWRAVLATPIGRQEMWALLNDYGAFKATFACGPTGFPQPEATWYQAGRRDAGQQLYRTLVKHDRAAVFAMHDEHDHDFAKPKRRPRNTDGA